MRWPFRKSPTILFLGGLSGSGKTSFARDYLRGNRGWYHIEIDVPMPGDGITDNGLREPWDKFQLVSPAESPRPRPLYRELLRRSAGHTHVVLSFSSQQIFTREQLEAAEGFFHFAYLFGQREACLAAFLDRERRAGSAWATPEHWNTNNDRLLRESRLFHNRDFLVSAFESDRTRRDPERIYEDVLKIIGVRT